MRKVQYKGAPVIIDFDKDGQVVGYEILQVSTLGRYQYQSFYDFMSGQKEVIVSYPDLPTPNWNKFTTNNKRSMVNLLRSLFRPKITHDKEADTVYVHVSNKKPVKQVEQIRKVVVDLDSRDRVVGVELLTTKKY